MKSFESYASAFEKRERRNFCWEKKNVGDSSNEFYVYFN